MNITVFCGSSNPKNETYAAMARELGRQLALRGDALVYGGSNLGLMGQVSGAALEAGGRVVAVIPTLFSEAIIQSQPVSELIKVRTMAERKERLIAMSDAFVALPGGIGTLDEVTEVLVANQLKQIEKPMYLLNPDGFYDPFLAQLAHMEAHGMMRTGAHIGLHTPATLEELLEQLTTLPGKN